MKIQPEYVKCVHDGSGRPISACGSSYRPFFLSLEHVKNAEDWGSRLLPCKACVDTLQARRPLYDIRPSTGSAGHFVEDDEVETER